MMSHHLIAMLGPLHTRTRMCVQMVEQMEGRVTDDVDSFRDELAGMRGEMAKALAAVSDLLGSEGSDGGNGSGSRLQRVQASVDVLQEGFQNASSCAQVRTRCYPSVSGRWGQRPASRVAYVTFTSICDMHYAARASAHTFLRVTAR